VYPSAITLQPMMTSITGLVRIAPIQSKFVNIMISLG
jgi:hypothetical protein